MTKKEFRKPSFASTSAKATADKKASEGKEKKGEIELGEIPFIGGLLKGIEKFINLAEKVEEAGGEIRKEGEIKGFGSRKDVKGIYGFSIRTGVGGKPLVQTFGNIKMAKKKAGEKEVRLKESREPMVDVFDEKDHILIIAELPGIDEKSIILEFKDDILILKAGSEERKYAKEILLPAQVDPQSKKTFYKNGILEIKITKKFK